MRIQHSDSLDNALVEGKNEAIIRKHMGWAHIPAEHAESLDQFYRKYLNPDVNFHRPCAFARFEAAHSSACEGTEVRVIRTAAGHPQGAPASL